MRTSLKLAAGLLLLSGLSVATWWYDALTVETAPRHAETEPRYDSVLSPEVLPLTVRAEHQTDRKGRNETAGAPITYAMYQQAKACFERQLYAAGLVDEIADLRNGLTSVSPNLRPVIENEIRAKEEQLLDSKKCLGRNEPPTASNLSDLLAAAAKSGDHVAQIEYAKDPQLDVFHQIANIDRWRDWRDGALKYIDSGINSGDSEAVIALAEAYDPLGCEAANTPNCGGLLSRIVQQDAADAYRLYFLRQLLDQGDAPAWLSAELQDLKSLMSPGEVESAEAEAKAKLHAIRGG